MIRFLLGRIAIFLVIISCLFIFLFVAGSFKLGGEFEEYGEYLHQFKLAGNSENRAFKTDTIFEKDGKKILFAGAFEDYIKLEKDGRVFSFKMKRAQCFLYGDIDLSEFGEKVVLNVLSASDEAMSFLICYPSQ